MTATFISLSVVFLVLTIVQLSKTETLWRTESDAEEEEEENMGNRTSENESFSSTFSPEDNPTTKFGFLLDKLIDSEENGLWSRRLNLSENEDLHDDNKHDASPENNVDRDSLENVNFFLQNKPITENSAIFKDELSTTEESLFSEKKFTKPISTIEIDTDEVTLPSVTTTTSECTFGDRKCKAQQVGGVRPLKFGDKLLASSTTNSVPTGSFWNVVKSDKAVGGETSETLEVYSSTVTTPESASVTVSSSESTSAQTSENVILIDGTELDKEESVIQNNQSNKNEKNKPIKPHDDIEIITDDGKSVIKMTTTSSLLSPTKEVASFSELQTPFPVPDTTPIISNFTKDETPFHLEPSLPVELITPAVEYVLTTPTESFMTPDAPFTDKMLESLSIDHSKMSPEIPNLTSTSSLLPTPSWHDAKSHTNTGVDKYFKGNTANALDVTPLSPSFRQSVESRETKRILIQPSTTSTETTPQTTVATTPNALPPFNSKPTSHSAEKQSPTQPTLREIELPPRLSYPSCSSLPVCVEVTLLETTWDQFCRQADDFRDFLSTYVSSYTRPIRPRHLILDTEICSKSSSVKPLQTSPDVTVAFYVTNDTGEYEERLTEICGIIMRKWTPTSFRSSVLEVRLPNSEIQSTPLPLIPEFNAGFVAAVSISAVAGVALCMLCILLVIMKQKLVAGRGSDTTTTPTADAYSLDSLSINASFRRRRTRRSARSYLNHAFNDQEIPSHPLDIKTLTNCLKSRDLLEEEFKKIPMNMPKLDSIPEGAHVKNRYSNILPRPETRVVIAESSGDPLKSYINANFVKGYEGKSAFYIACQAPLPDGIEDFWRMVWEQQSRVVVMLTLFEENGTSRCAQYFPQSTLVSQPPFGDFQISLVKKDVYEFYTKSTLRLLDLEKNLFRDVIHLWFTGWPDVGVPKDPSSLITFVQQCRPYVNSNTGPTIVHCSTGTGRTGVFLALDICMREYEESRSIDILQCVSQLRRGRGGAVQNKDQYILIYEAILEYVSRVSNQSHCPSVCSKNSREM
ncbi:hypothetical protein JTE90_019721 [Oedothorax gibbosus]|uniref:protein-tyrosine-phosphatase n=1 Tax=Oedothorax gibbosus TaxID=931172 RepID=A0AAV6UMV9_9ARAC|nr:hypothetical protein JTE90_019721 [Oedothorax gibbosus]